MSSNYWKVLEQFRDFLTRVYTNRLSGVSELLQESIWVIQERSGFVEWLFRSLWNTILCFALSAAEPGKEVIPEKKYYWLRESNSRPARWESHSLTSRLSICRVRLSASGRSQQKGRPAATSQSKHDYTRRHCKDYPPKLHWIGLLRLPKCSVAVASSHTNKVEKVEPETLNWDGADIIGFSPC